MGGTPPSTSGTARHLCCLFQPNGVHPSGWKLPVLEGSLDASTLPRVLSPLARHRGNFSVITGLQNSGSGHVQLTSAFLSGVPVVRGKAGISLDQLAASVIGRDTRLPSLVLGTEPPRQGSTSGEPISLSNTVSWITESSRIQPQIDPQMVFDRLFRVSNDALAQRNNALRQSVVDLVAQDAKELRKKASGRDQEKLDQYLTTVREIELRLQRLAAAPPTDSHDPPIVPSFVLSREHRQEHLRSILEIAALALWTDSTRIVTVMTAHGFSRLDYGFIEGVKGDHHGLSHHKDLPDTIEQYNRISHWFVEQFAWFLDRLKALPDGTGTLLDSTLVLYGSGMKDGNGHAPVDLPVVVAGGRNGPLKMGQVIRTTTGTPLANLLLTLARGLGMELSSLNGVSTGPIDALMGP
ncbi:MAG: DUF1552 domain-containing protein [Verrucomicrobiales bacterium]